MLYSWKVRLLKTRRGGLLWRYWRAWRGDDVGEYRRLPEYIREYAPGRSFVDIGCMWGVNGEYAFVAEEAGANTVKAVDVFGPTPEFEAKKQARNSAVEFILGDATQPETIARVGVVDVVFCAGVLYHHPSPFDLLVALRRMCRQTLVLRTSTIPEIEELKNAAVYYPMLEPEDRRLWNLSSLGVIGQVGIAGGFEPEGGYGNWFWGLTPSCVASLLETAGFRVERRATEAFAHTFICSPVEVPFEHHLPSEAEVRRSITWTRQESPEIISANSACSADEGRPVRRYTKEYYEALREGARRSARVVVPLVLELVRPRHVIDVGCGVGTWLSVFEACGVEDVWGVDGFHVDKTTLEIPAERFISFDLEQPFRMEQRFDLVASLEVAEHLPAECAESFVDSLTRLGPVVLFSAATPFQGGEHHVNERWPDYWTELFREKGYVPIDCLRREIWQNEDVEWWYAQNTLMFVSQDSLGSYPALRRGFENTAASQLSIIHPKKYLETNEWIGELYSMTQDIAALIPPEDNFVLVDDGLFGSVITAGHRAIPFLERGGRYQGASPDDATAIRELERLRRSGASFMVFAWPAFWWLDYCSGLHHHLRSQFRCVLQNDRLVAFDLRS